MKSSILFYKVVAFISFFILLIVQSFLVYNTYKLKDEHFYFKEKNINYTEYNVASDATKRTEMIERSGQMGVPVIQIDDNVIIGFDKDTIVELLEIK